MLDQAGGAFKTDAGRIGMATEHGSCPGPRQIAAMIMYLFHYLLCTLSICLFACLSSSLSS